MKSQALSKAQSWSDDAVKKAANVRKKYNANAATPQKPPGRITTSNVEVDESKVEMMSAMGVPPVTARLALINNKGNVGLACNWLFDEKNAEEIEAAEAAEMENAFILSAEFKNAPNREESPSKRSRAVEKPEQEKSPSREGSPSKRRRSISSDDGCGLGRFMRRESFPSPRKVPVPGRLSTGSRLSRGSVESARLSTGSSAAGRTACIDDDEDRAVVFHAYKDILSETWSPGSPSQLDAADSLSQATQQLHERVLQENYEQEVILFEDSPARSKPLQVLQESLEQKVTLLEDSPVCSKLPQAMAESSPKLPQVAEADEGSEGSDDCDDDEESDQGFEAEVQHPFPPASECWDWPLSRHEKVARVQMLERQMHAVDRSTLMQKLAELQGDQTDRLSVSSCRK
jgi:hypothetical protein